MANLEKMRIFVTLKEEEEKEEEKLDEWREKARFAIWFWLAMAFMTKRPDFVNNWLQFVPRGTDSPICGWRDSLAFLANYVAPLVAWYGVESGRSNALLPFLGFCMVRAIEPTAFVLVLVSYMSWEQWLVVSVYVCATTIGLALIALIDLALGYFVYRCYRQLVEVEAINNFLKKLAGEWEISDLS